MNTITPKMVNISYKGKIKRNSNLSKNNPLCKKAISFKGAPTSLITEADRQILNVFSQHYGNIGERLGQKVGKLVTSSEILKKSSRFALEEGALSIREKGLFKALVENIFFPVINLPLYTVSWVLKKAQNIPALKEGASSLYKKPLLRIPRKLNELDEKTDIIKGIFDKTKDTVAKFAKEKGVTTEYLFQQLNKTDDNPQAQQLVKEANEYIKESLYKVSNKFFDKHTGNFNTAYERPLNRIITGLIPVAFLANDAYNLSVLCGDKKDVSKKEANARKKQEISRVFTTAYIQLLTFGAFTKQVNTIPWFTPLTSAATVLFSEITSRRHLGKPIFFLSKEKAKEYNKREKEEPKKKRLFSFKKQTKKTDINKSTTDKNQNSNSNKSVPYIIVPENEPKIFTSFKSANIENNIVNKSNQQIEKNADNTQKEKTKTERKALINFDTFKKGVGILVAGGFLLSFIKNSSYTKNSSLVRGIKGIGDYCKKKIYNPLAFKDFELAQSEFDKICKSLKDSGCKEIAEGHDFIRQKYGRQTAEGILKLYKGAFDISKSKDLALDAINVLRGKGTILTDKEIKQITESVRTAIELEGTSIAEMKYNNVAKKLMEIITNKKINISNEDLELLSNTISETIKQKAKEAPIQVETKLKPFVDIVTQPFKFIMSAMKLPYKITSTIVKIAVSPVEKKAAEAAIGKAELTQFEQTIHKVVTEIFGEKTAKAGKTSQVIFANAMEKLQKQTLPYRKALEAFERATTTGSKAEIAKAQEALDKAKNELSRYVNTAVEKSFNGVTQSSNKNTDLAMMSKLASSAVTSAFLVADNYNMVMLKSNGEDKDGAKEKANERIIQRLSALFYQTLFINWFNATFRTTYNSSLKGMAAVAIPNTLTTEILTRKSIGMPVGRKSLEELQKNEEKNENRKGFIGKYFKFMRLLTGKKPLKDRLPKDKAKQNNATTAKTQSNNTSAQQYHYSSTNLIERFSKK